MTSNIRRATKTLLFFRPARPILFLFTIVMLAAMHSPPARAANRELALLKHMFNLAIDWDLYLGSNPLRKVKFFQEVNTGIRVLKPDEETGLLRKCHTAIQDVVFTL